MLLGCSLRLLIARLVVYLYAGFGWFGSYLLGFVCIVVMLLMLGCYLDNRFACFGVVLFCGFGWFGFSARVGYGF